MCTIDFGYMVLFIQKLRLLFQGKLNECFVLYLFLFSALQQTSESILTVNEYDRPATAIVWGIVKNERRILG